jgi:hypothetical protein
MLASTDVIWDEYMLPGPDRAKHGRDRGGTAGVGDRGDEQRPVRPAPLERWTRRLHRCPPPGTTRPVHEDGEPVFIECNPRTVEPGNAAASGVNLPLLSIALAAG